MDRAEMTLSQEIHALADQVPDPILRARLYDVADRVDQKFYVVYRLKMAARNQRQRFAAAQERAPVLASGANASATNHAGVRTQ